MGHSRPVEAFFRFGIRVRVSLLKAKFEPLPLEILHIMSRTKRHIKNKGTFTSELLDKQKGRCYWCDREFGSVYIKAGKVKILQIHIDHIIPYSYTQNSRNDNLVASCNICNLFKSSKYFHNEDDCYLYLMYKWAKSIADRKIVLIGVSFGIEKIKIRKSREEEKIEYRVISDNVIENIKTGERFFKKEKDDSLVGIKQITIIDSQIQFS